MKPVVVYGTGAFAEMVHFYLKHDSPYDVVAFTEDVEDPTAERREYRGLPRRSPSSVGRSNIIGGGAVIMHDTEDDEVYVAERTRASGKKSHELNF